MFSALQRQLNYPVVPRLEYSPQVDLIPTLERKIHQLETRVKLLESELKGSFDLSQFLCSAGRFWQFGEGNFSVVGWSVEDTKWVISQVVLCLY